MTVSRWSLQEIAGIVDGTLRGDGTGQPSAFLIDSRENVSGALFLALRGEKFDGHDFVANVRDRGALGAIVEQFVEDVDFAQIRVADSLSALQNLGRKRRQEFRGPVAAITGSAGKTTTRRLLASVLSQRYVTHQPVRNFNNHVGVPLTLLGLDSKHQAAVLELGCSDFGEIAALTQMSRPDLGLITNVGPAHLECLGDLDGVARAKGELFGNLGKDATCVVNSDDIRIPSIPVHTERQVRFGKGKDADVRLVSRRPEGRGGQHIVFEIRGERFGTRFPLVGAHNASNALAAVAAAWTIGMNASEIIAGLQAAEGEPGRLSLITGPKGSLVVDDTYNANPASMRAAIDAVIEMREAGKVIAVLGDMLELGPGSEQAHRALGEYTGEQGVSVLVTVGRFAKYIGQGAATRGLSPSRIHVAEDTQAAAEVVEREIEPDAVVLVKGSRGMQMEKVLSFLGMRRP